MRKLDGLQDLWRSIGGEDRSGQPGKETDLFEASDHYYHEQFMESFSSTNYSKLDYDPVLGLLKSGKLRLRRTIRAT